MKATNFSILGLTTAVLITALTVGGCPGTIQLPDVNMGTFNQPPNADAGPDKSVIAGQRIQLDATRSSDPDGEPLRYLWEQTYGPMTVELENANQRVASFMPTTPGDYEFVLTVSDSANLSGTDTIIVSVGSPEDSPAPWPIPGDDEDDDPPRGDDEDDGTPPISGDGVLSEILCRKAIVANIGGVELVCYDESDFTIWEVGDLLSIEPNEDYDTLTDFVNTRMNDSRTGYTLGEIFDRGAVTAIDRMQEWVEVEGHVWEISMFDDVNGWEVGHEVVITHEVESDSDTWRVFNLDLCAYVLLSL